MTTTKDNNQILRVLRGFNEETIDEKNRGRSWEICYEFFRRPRGGNEWMYSAQLHLAFYLASWGMYRGSSFLLQKSCFIFEPVIEEIMNEDYRELWNFERKTIKNLNDRQNEIWKKIEKVSDGIYNHLSPLAKEEAEKSGKKTTQPTNTLITKILMGTMGCVPAYDDYFLKGLRKHQKPKIKNRTFNYDSFKELVRFYQENSNEFEKSDISFRTHKDNLLYPPMKNLDLYFWGVGRKSEKIEQTNSTKK